MSSHTQPLCWIGSALEVTPGVERIERDRQLDVGEMCDRIVKAIEEREPDVPGRYPLSLTTWNAGEYKGADCPGADTTILYSPGVRGAGAEICPPGPTQIVGTPQSSWTIGGSGKHWFASTRQNSNSRNCAAHAPSVRSSIRVPNTRSVRSLPGEMRVGETSSRGSERLWSPCVGGKGALCGRAHPRGHRTKAVASTIRTLCMGYKRPNQHALTQETNSGSEPVLHGAARIAAAKRAPSQLVEACRQQGTRPVQ